MIIPKSTSGVKPHISANCPFAAIRDIQFPNPPETVIEFISGFRKLPVVYPTICDIWFLGITKRLAFEQHGVRLRFFHETMLSRRRDREGYYRLLIADAYHFCLERTLLADDNQDADEFVGMIPVSGGASHA